MHRPPMRPAAARLLDSILATAALLLVLLAIGWAPTAPATFDHHHDARSAAR